MKLNRIFIPPKTSDWFSIGFIDGVPFYQGEYDHLLEIDIEKYERIKEWVDTKLMPYMTCKSFNEDISSYNLKHIAEKELGFYVCNGHIKYILLENNVPFKAYDLNPNTIYPICKNFQNSPQSLEKLNRGGNMNNYFENIKNSSLSIYDIIDIKNDNLFIPIDVLEKMLDFTLDGISLFGYPLRTRAKIVKTAVCEALGYPVPKSFKKTQPRFYGQNLDIYVQKRLNLQVWNEEIDPLRRYAIIKVNEDDKIVKVRVIFGEQLAQYDNTGTLTTKYQATMRSFNDSKLLSESDTEKVSQLCCSSINQIKLYSSNALPQSGQLIDIKTVYNLLLPLVGQSIKRIDALQERNRGAELHKLVCSRMGFSDFSDDGKYPDILNQLIEIKLQTSPTIDLGLHLPSSEEPIFQSNGIWFSSSDIRYVIFDATISEDIVCLNKLYVVNGENFCNYFPLFKGKVQNAKLQLPLPINFFGN